MNRILPAYPTPCPPRALCPSASLALLLAPRHGAHAQEPEHPAKPHKLQRGPAPAGEAEARQHEGKESEGKEAEEEEPATDVTLFFGSDFIRPDLLVPRANLAFAIGHSFHFLRNDPLGRQAHLRLHLREHRHPRLHPHPFRRAHRAARPAARHQARPLRALLGLHHRAGRHLQPHRRPGAEPLLDQPRRRVDRALHPQPLPLVPGALQQGRNCTLVHGFKHRLHLQLLVSSVSGHHHSFFVIPEGNLLLSCSPLSRVEPLIKVSS